MPGQSLVQPASSSGSAPSRWRSLAACLVILGAAGCTDRSVPPILSSMPAADVPGAPPDAGLPFDRPLIPPEAGLPSDRPSAPPEAPPPLPAPSSFGPGFTDLSTPFDGAPPAFLAVPREAPGEDPEPTVGLFADLDNDGAPEVLFGATNDGPPGRTTLAYDYSAARGLSLRGPLGTASGSDRLAVAAVFDLDDDGLQDLITNRPEAEIAWGLGAGRFTAPTSFTPRTGQWSPSYGALLLDDFDDDGWLDIAFGIANCCPTCRSMKLMLRDGPRSFVDRTALLGDAPAASTYAMLRATLNGARLLVHVGQPCSEQDSPTFFRQRPLDAEGFAPLEPFDPIPTDAYIRANDPSFGNRVLSLSHWVPMGAAVGDADGDGRVDLAISLNFYVGLFQDRGAFPLVDHTAQFGERPPLSDSSRRMIPWGLALVDLDQDGRLDLFTTHGDDHSSASDPAYFIGPQYSTVHWNAGSMAFTNVTPLLGVGRRGQWRSLAVGDLDRDGDADLLVGSQAANPRLLRNDIATGNHGFSLRLRGTTSNAAGVGARVEVKVSEGQPEQVHVMGAVGSPLVFSTPLVFAGLGRATRAERVRITWPSGLVQELRDVAAGSLHTVEEPAFIGVMPAARHLPADGRATATVRVTPRRPDGTLREDARVEVALARGGGSITPARWTGEAWEATVTAPMARGSSVVEVRVDGVAAGVRPRLWWD